MFEKLSQSIHPLGEMRDWVFDDNTTRHLSAVLIPIVTRDNKHSIILSTRTLHLNHHAGQISFPGGRAEKSDLNAINTALRETFEEIGIPAHQIKTLGFLDDYATVSDFIITPVVAHVEVDYHLEIDSNEVAEVFEVPCEVLLNAESYQQNKIFWQGELRLFWEINYEGRHIWGATAAILKNLAECLVRTDKQV